MMDMRTFLSPVVFGDIKICGHLDEIRTRGILLPLGQAQHRFCVAFLIHLGFPQDTSLSFVNENSGY